jgi:hypothetical protein
MPFQFAKSARFIYKTNSRSLSEIIRLHSGPRMSQVYHYRYSFLFYLI